MKIEEAERIRDILDATRQKLAAATAEVGVPLFYNCSDYSEKAEKYVELVKILETLKIPVDDRALGFY